MTTIDGFSNVLEILQRLISAKSRTRAKIFADEVKPLLDDMLNTHREFLSTIQKLTNSATTLGRISESRSIEIEAIELEVVALRDVMSVLENERGYRRLYYERAKTKAQNDRGPFYASRVSKLLSLSSEEADAVLEFFVSVAEYFETETKQYNHDMRHLVRVLQGFFELYKLNNAEQFKDRADNFKLRIAHKEASLERQWAIIAQKFATVESFLLGA